MFVGKLWPKIKSRASVHRIDWIDVYRVNGPRTVLENIEVDMGGDLCTDRGASAQEGAQSAKTLLAHFFVGSEVAEISVLTDLDLGRFAAHLDIGRVLRVDDSGTKIAMGACYLNNPKFDVPVCRCCEQGKQEEDQLQGGRLPCKRQKPS